MRQFPALWTVEENKDCFVVREVAGPRSRMSISQPDRAAVRRRRRLRRMKRDFWRRRSPRCRRCYGMAKPPAAGSNGGATRRPTFPLSAEPQLLGNRLRDLRRGRRLLSGLRQPRKCGHAGHTCIGGSNPFPLRQFSLFARIRPARAATQHGRAATNGPPGGIHRRADLSYDTWVVGAVIVSRRDPALRGERIYSADGLDQLGFVAVVTLGVAAIGIALCIWALL